MCGLYVSYLLPLDIVPTGPFHFIFWVLYTSLITWNSPDAKHFFTVMTSFFFFFNFTNKVYESSYFPQWSYLWWQIIFQWCHQIVYNSKFIETILGKDLHTPTEFFTKKWEACRHLEWCNTFARILAIHWEWWGHFD